MFASLFKSGESNLPIRVVAEEDTTGEGLIYPTQFATFLAHADACRSDTQKVLAAPNEPPQPTDVLPQM